jgi:hypothetical protein
LTQSIESSLQQIFLILSSYYGFFRPEYGFSTAPEGILLNQPIDEKAAAATPESNEPEAPADSPSTESTGSPAEDTAPTGNPVRSCLILFGIIAGAFVLLMILVFFFWETFAINSFHNELHGTYDQSKLTWEEKAEGKQLADDITEMLRSRKENPWSEEQILRFRALSTTWEFFRAWGEAEGFNEHELRTILPLLRQMIQPENALDFPNHLLDTEFSHFTAYVWSEIEQSGLDAAEKTDGKKTLDLLEQVVPHLVDADLSSLTEIHKAANNLNHKWLQAIINRSGDEGRMFKDDALRDLLFASLNLIVRIVETQGNWLANVDRSPRVAPNSQYADTPSGQLLEQADDYLRNHLSLKDKSPAEAYRGLENLYESVLLYRKLSEEHKGTPEAEEADKKLGVLDKWFALENEARAEGKAFLDKAKEFQIDQAQELRDEALALVEKYSGTTLAPALHSTFVMLDDAAKVAAEPEAEDYVRVAREADALRTGNKFGEAHALWVAFKNEIEKQVFDDMADRVMAQLEIAAVQFVNAKLTENTEISDEEKIALLESLRPNVTGMNTEKLLDTSIERLRNPEKSGEEDSPDESGDAPDENSEDTPPKESNE